MTRKPNIHHIKGYLGTNCPVTGSDSVMDMLSGESRLILKPIESCDLNKMSYKTIMGLYENHYDIHGLIGLGFAVDFKLV